MPDEADLRAVHDVLEGAFTDHFNSTEETFDEFIHRLREDPGHRWDHWWLAEIDGEAAGALVGTVSESSLGPGRLLRLLPRCARDGPRPRRRQGAAPHDHRRRCGARPRSRRPRGRRRLPTGADRLYVAMGWGTKYVTESWHKDVAVFA